MDYILQMEKLYKFLEFTLDFSEIRVMYNIKHKFNNDLNLFASFIKDFLTIKNNGVISSDDALYDDFVIWLENGCENKEKCIKEISEYAKYYLMIVFEDIEDENVLSAISTINACFAIDCYPNLMSAFNKYYNHRMDRNIFYKMLELITDVVLKRYEEFEGSVLSFIDLEEKLKLIEPERAVI